jgi:hypothetical protein
VLLEVVPAVVSDQPCGVVYEGGDPSGLRVVCDGPPETGDHIAKGYEGHLIR